MKIFNRTETTPVAKKEEAKSSAVVKTLTKAFVSTAAVVAANFSVATAVGGAVALAEATATAGALVGATAVTGGVMGVVASLAVLVALFTKPAKATSTLDAHKAVIVDTK